MLKQFNDTLIALVPKIPRPKRVTDFRPISCCNTLYKWIAKMLANRLKKCLPVLISWNQSAFVAARRIQDNIILAQKVVNDYSRANGKPRCAIKVDLMKAFDLVHLLFVNKIMKVLGCLDIFIKWIQECITIAVFSVRING